MLFKFKSIFCPFSLIPHDKFSCVYAHNWQDYKRPFDKRLKSIKCKNWNKDKKLAFYTDGCGKGKSCQFTHGWKELEYHFKNYKTLLCLAKDCRK